MSQANTPYSGLTGNQAEDFKRGHINTPMWFKWRGSLYLIRPRTFDVICAMKLKELKSPLLKLRDPLWEWKL